jgi:hypothetical protein
MIKRYCNESDDYYETKMLTKNHPKTKEAYTEVVYNSNPLPKQFSYWKTGFAFYRYPQTGCSYAFQGQSSALKIFIEHLLIRHFQILAAEISGFENYLSPFHHQKAEMPVFLLGLQ